MRDIDKASSKLPYKLITSYNAKFLQSNISTEKRNEILENQSILSSNPFTVPVIKEIPMLWYEELIVILFWFIFFGSMLYGPFISLYLLIYHRYYGLLFLTVSLIVSFIPTNFNKNSCYRYIFTLILKYFSHQGIWSEYIPLDKPSIIVGPPHGVFPFGSLLACMSVPRSSGTTIRGIAASALTYYPLIGNFLRYIGIIDANRNNVLKHLRNGESIGISSGGIAEIFETTNNPINNFNRNQECIILKSRHGICKLALLTGSYVIPSYIFGNSKCLSIWYDKYGLMLKLSRMLKISIVFFWGRWFLPIPYRTPILGVLGEPIEVKKIDNPTKEDIENLLSILQNKIKELFDKHKAAYGWQNVELIIK